MGGIFQQCAAGMHDESRFRNEYLALKAEELLIAIAQQVELLRQNVDLEPKMIIRLKKLRNAMSIHPEMGWTVAQMAEQVYLSESYFYQVYREAFRISPNRDLIEMRLTRARKLLSDGCSVSATAELCGYKSIYHFIRQFRQYVGKAPGEYRRSL